MRTVPRLKCPRALSNLAFAAAAAVAGCGDMPKLEFGSKKKPPPEPAPLPQRPPDEVTADTVGSLVVVSGAGPLKVRGFGLVIGLGDRGSEECPRALREYLHEYLTKTYKLDSAGPESSLSPSKLIESVDTAPVEIAGIIPAGAPAGTRMDVYVEAVDGTQTRSLEGGLLLPCELKLVDVSYRGDKILAGRTMARAGGPIFTDPLMMDEDSGGVANPRSGMVLGGGVSLEPRNVRLTLLNPSYSDARRIEQRINERFGGSPKTAEGMSRTYVEVRTPPGYADDPMRFVRLASHVYLYNEPEFYEQQLQKLAALAVAPDPPYEDLALSWEAIGGLGLKQVQPLYGDDDGQVRFVAAQAGLRLNDFAAVDVMGQIARDAEHPRRIDAIAELGRSDRPQAVNYLVPLLDDRSDDVRLAAYEALLQHGHPAIETRIIRGPTDVSFRLDSVESDGQPLVYIRRAGEPRITLFGPRTTCRMPMFYAHPEGWVTLTAAEATGDVTLFCRTRHGNRLSDRLFVTPRISDLIVSMADRPVKDETGKVRGLGLTYSQVVQVLRALGEEEILPAKVVMQKTLISEMLKSRTPRERPEGDAPLLLPDPPGQGDPTGHGVENPPRPEGEQPPTEQPSEPETPREEPPRR